MKQVKLIFTEDLNNFLFCSHCGASFSEKDEIYIIQNTNNLKCEIKHEECLDEN